MIPNHKLLSVCIPTYNRAACLQRLLENIIPQILELEEGAEICISDNASSDNTRDIVAEFQKKYPHLVRYRVNPENLGFDKNVFAVVNMAEGDFVWTFSDDDLVVEHGVREVVQAIQEPKDKQMGGLLVRFASYTSDPKTGKTIQYQNSLAENKPKTYGGLTCLEMLLDDNSFGGMSELIFNNVFLKRLLADERQYGQAGIGTHHLHMWLFLLLFIRNRDARFYVLNMVIAISPDTLSKAQYNLDDHFELLYRSRIQFFDKLLVHVDESDESIRSAIKTKLIRRPVLSMIHIMGLYIAFGEATRASCLQALKLAFRYLSYLKAFLVLTCLVGLWIVPSSLVKWIWKTSLRFRARTKDKSQPVWEETEVVFGSWSRGAEGKRSAKGTGIFLNTE